MKKGILIILLVVFNHFEAFTQNEKGKYRILTFGYRSVNDNAELVVNQKWGIEKFAVAGCIVNEKLIDSVKNHNKNTWALISNNNGTQNSKLNYQKDILYTRKDFKRIENLVYRNDLTNEIWKNLKDKNKGYLIFENPKFVDESTYSISVKKQKRKNNNKPKNLIYTLTIDLPSETIVVEK